MLFDWSYVLNTATRIAFGQTPYRDFPLPHAPLTFLTQAAIIRLTGRVFFHHALYAALVGGLGTVVTWRIAFETLRGRVRAAWLLALMLAAPLVFLGVYCVVPNPEYDCDCAFWILVAVWLLQRLEDESHASRKNSNAAMMGHPRSSWRRFRGFVAGAIACLPLFFKQNMGLPFLAAVIGAVLLVLAAKWTRRTESIADSPETGTLPAVLAGAFAALLAAALALHWTAGIGDYVQWTVKYAAQRRLPELNLMAGIYRDPTLLWTLPCVALALLLLRFTPQKSRWAQIASFALLAAPFLFALASLPMYVNPDDRGDRLLALWPLVLLLAAALAIVNLLSLRREPSLRAFLPLILVAAVNGTFMSQQLWG